MSKDKDKCGQFPPKPAHTAPKYDILKDFSGMNDGAYQHFSAGSQGIALDDDLAAVTVRKGWAREVKPCAS